MNPYEQFKPAEHIVGFKQEPAPTAETMRKAGFKATDVICWANKDGLVFFQNGDEFYRPKTT